MEKVRKRVVCRHFLEGCGCKSADFRSASDRNRINARSRTATAAATTIARDPANSVLDPNEVAEVEALVEFVGISRCFAGELAINEMTHHALTELRQYSDNGTQALLEGLRHAGESPFSRR